MEVQEREAGVQREDSAGICPPPRLPGTGVVERLVAEVVVRRKREAVGAEEPAGLNFSIARAEATIETLARASEADVVDLESSGDLGEPDPASPVRCVLPIKLESPFRAAQTRR